MPSQTPRYLSTTPTAGTPLEPEYLSTDPHGGTPPATAPDAPDRSPLGSVGAFAGEALQSVNPVAINRALQQTFWHPIDTAKGLLSAQDQVRQKGVDAFQRGDYVTGTRHFVDWLIPVLGPRLDQAADWMQQGEVAKGLGASVDVAAQMAGPAALKQIPSLRVTPTVAPVTGPDAAAVAFGQARNIPVDLATATGNRFVRGVQAMTESTPIGSVVGSRARQARGAALTRVGDDLAAAVHPVPVSPEQAGEAVQQAVKGQAAASAAAADTAYTTLRALEAKTPVTVDIAHTKAAMQPAYDALRREAQLVPLMGDKARALTTLDRLMQAPNTAPLSVADSALGDLKAVARVDDTFRRTVGQGVAAQTVKNLEAAVQTAARTGGRDMLQALQEGRAATVQKFQAIDLLDQLRAEPVGVFRQATYAKDAGITTLRDLARQVPAEMPKLGRAYLDDLVRTATAEGGFDRAPALARTWQNLGPQTKALLFPGRVKDLDNFFLLAKRLAESPNPSGTATTAHSVGSLMGTFLHPTTGLPYMLTAGGIAKLLNSERGVQLLTQGARLPAGARMARAALAAQVTRLLGEDRALVPVTADEDPAPWPATAGAGR